MLTVLLETACRREGLLNLTPDKLRPARQAVLLDEKGSRVREQPVSLMMMEYLQQPGCPIYRWTRRRLDSLWARIRRELPWADELGLSTHWFRHTTITNVERTTRSYALAAAFAGHTLSGIGATPTYIAAYQQADIAWAFVEVFGGTPSARHTWPNTFRHRKPRLKSGRSNVATSVVVEDILKDQACAIGYGLLRKDLCA